MKTISPTIYDILDLIIYEQVNETGPLHQAMKERGYSDGQFKGAFHNTLVRRWGAVEEMMTHQEAVTARKQYARDDYYRWQIVPEQLFIHLGPDWEDRLWMKHGGWDDWDKPRSEILDMLDREGNIMDQQFEVVAWENADKTIAAHRVRWLLNAFEPCVEYWVQDSDGDWTKEDFDDLPKKVQRELKKMGLV